MITVRFLENQHYDINQDCEVVVLMAMTSKGSYFAEVPLEEGRALREARQKFKEVAIECIQNDIDPCEVDLELSA
jgi:hypothetical protein